MFVVIETFCDVQRNIKGKFTHNLFIQCPPISVVFE